MNWDTQTGFQRAREQVGEALLPPAGRPAPDPHARAHPGARQPALCLAVPGGNYLRSHPMAAGGYANLKRVLAEYHADDNEAYTLIKDPVCDIIMNSAEEWARGNGVDELEIIKLKESASHSLCTPNNGLVNSSPNQDSDFTNCCVYQS
jgi:hypothetical protein